MKMNKFLLSLILLGTLIAMLLLAGCSSNEETVTAGSGLLYVKLWTDNKCASVGDTVNLRATVINGGNDTQVVELTDQPVVDIIIGDTDTSKIRWSAGKPMTTDLTRLELKPGESKSIEMQWKVVEPMTVVSAQLISGPNWIKYPTYAHLGLGICTGPIGP